MGITSTEVIQDTAFSNALSPIKWVKRITETWQKQVPAILEVASLLERAKDELRHGDWMKVVKAELPFSQSTANKLLKLAKSEHLRNLDHWSKLPACWRTLYELTLLTAEQFEHGIATGTIHPGMQRRDIKSLRGTVAVGTTGTKTPSAFAVLKDRADQQAREIQQLKQQLANVQDGSQFDLTKDKAKDIAKVIADTISEAKLDAIYEGAKTAFKAKKKGTSDAQSP